MIFKETWQQVLNGTKTQTRRPLKPWDRAVALEDGKINRYWYPPLEIYRVINEGEKRDRIKWQVGKTYAVQPGQGKKAVGRIRITKIRRERLQEMVPLDLRAEMGCSKDDPRRFAIYLLPKFIKLWNSLYRKPYDWASNPECWVLGFERVIGKEKDEKLDTIGSVANHLAFTN